MFIITCTKSQCNVSYRDLNIIYEFRFVENNIEGWLYHVCFTLRCVGAVPGMCHSTDLVIGQEFILTLRDPQRLIPTEHQLGADKMDEVAQACGLQPFAPEGTYPLKTFS